MTDKTHDPELLRRLLASREHMKSMLAQPAGAKGYWKWRAETLALLASPTQPVCAQVAFDSDFSALLSAYDLLYTLSTECDLTDEEQSTLHQLREHIRSRSTIAPTHTT